MKLRIADDWFVATDLTDGVIGISEPGHVEEVISYLWIRQDHSILIDSGMGLFSMKNFVISLTDTPVSLLNTHSHFDHVGSNFEFDDIALFDHPDNRRVAEIGKDARSLEKWITPEQLWGKVPEGIANPYRIRPFTHARFLRDGESLTVGSTKLTVIHTPGHSDDSISFFAPEQGHVFCGDLLYDGPIYIQKIGGLAKYRASLERILSLEGLKTLFPAHNSCVFELTKLHHLYEVVSKLRTIELDEEVTIDGGVRLVPC